MNEAEKNAIGAARQVVDAIQLAMSACQRAGFTGVEVRICVDELLSQAEFLVRIVEGK